MHKQKQTLILISEGGGEGVVVATPLGLLQHIKHSTQKGMYLFSYVYVCLSHVNVHTGINDAVC